MKSSFLLLGLLANENLQVYSFSTSICTRSDPELCLSSPTELSTLQITTPSTISFPLEVSIFTDNTYLIYNENTTEMELTSTPPVLTDVYLFETERRPEANSYYISDFGFTGCFTISASDDTLDISTTPCEEDYNAAVSANQVFEIENFYAEFLQVDEDDEGSIPNNAPTKEPVGPYQPFGTPFKTWFTSILLAILGLIAIVFALKFGSMPDNLRDGIDNVRHTVGGKAYRDKYILEAVKRENNL